MISERLFNFATAMAHIVRLGCIFFLISWFGVSLNKSSLFNDIAQHSSPAPNSHPFEDLAILEISENHDDIVHLVFGANGYSPVSSTSGNFTVLNERLKLPSFQNIISPPPESLF